MTADSDAGGVSSRDCSPYGKVGAVFTAVACGFLAFLIGVAVVATAGIILIHLAGLALALTLCFGVALLMWNEGC